MVGSSLRPDGGTVPDDRGQLILIGGIAMALIVIGLVLVVNTALFTQVVGSEGTVEGTKDAGVAAEELEDSASAIVHHENLVDADATASDVDGPINGTLDAKLLNASLDGSGAYSEIVFVDTVDLGTAYVQDSTASFEESGADWDPLPSGEAGQVGHFLMVVDTSQSSGQMSIRADGDSGGTKYLNLSVSHPQMTLDPSASASCTVEATNDTVRIDPKAGLVYEDNRTAPDCDFGLFDGLDAPYELSFHDTSGYQGQYYIVINETFSSVQPCNGQTDCRQAIWSYELAYEYDSSEVTATDESYREVEVYE